MVFFFFMFINHNYLFLFLVYNGDLYNIAFKIYSQIQGGVGVRESCRWVSTIEL